MLYSMLPEVFGVVCNDMGLAIAVMMAMALGHIQQGRPEQMRSLVRPIPATG